MLASACGGGSSPSSPVAPGPSLSLPEGTYQLAVYSSEFSCLMVGYGSGGPISSHVDIPVSVAVAGDKWQVNAIDSSRGSLAITLAKTGAGVSGMAVGTLLAPGVAVTLQHQVSGAPNGANAGVVGAVAGTVNYASAGGTAFCSTNLWSLIKP